MTFQDPSNGNKRVEDSCSVLMLHSLRYVGDTIGFRAAKKPALHCLIASEKNPDDNAPHKKANR